MCKDICFKLSFLLLIFSSFKSYTNGEPIINTIAGMIQGKNLEFSEGNVTEYLGIPFAYPPMGLYRFRGPVELEKPAWNGTFNAVKLAKHCFQPIQNMKFTEYDDVDSKNLISEDCLQLNIWVPHKTSGDVIVFIFGGDYNSGSPSLDIYNGSILALKTQSIIVNLNYRLGIFAFGYLGESSEIKGNMGLLDQQLALKWVHENIYAFGGDPSKVTLFGESAGGASVTAHLFSSGSHQYFSKVIIVSGVISNVWATVPEDIAEANTRNVSALLHCNGTDTEILKCLQDVNATTLLNASLTVKHPKQLPLNISFLPIHNDTVFFNGCVEKKIFKKDMKKDVDMLVGITFDEANNFMHLILKKYDCRFDLSKDITSKENLCLLDDNIYKGVVEMISKMIDFNEQETKFLYNVYSKMRANTTKGKIYELLRDFLFDCTIASFAQRYYGLTNKKVYFYDFKHPSFTNPNQEFVGLMYGQDLLYLFGYPFRHPEKYTSETLEEEKKFSEKLMGYIKKFVSFGDLGETWQEFNSNSTKTLVINEHFLETSDRKYVNALSRTCKSFDMIISSFVSRNVKTFVKKQVLQNKNLIVFQYSSDIKI
uniref:Carboxylic ester hydrolase n=1 Tax=Strongyloides venezuelensis TaxID=75913 RepID=A0A0K0FV27_STRVS